MESPFEPASNLSAPPRAPVSPRRPAAWLWVTLGVLCFAMYGLQLAGRAPSESIPDPADAGSITIKLQSRVVLALQAGEGMYPGMFSGQSQTNARQVLDQLEDANPTAIDRLRATPMAFVAGGKPRALEHLDLTEHAINLALEGRGLESEDKERLEALLEDASTLRAMYAQLPDEPEAAPEAETETEAEAAPDAPSDEPPDADPPPPSADELDRLTDRHNWFARLAAAQTLDTASPGIDAFEREGVRTLVIVLVFVGTVLLAGLLGMFLFIVTMAMIAGRSFQWRLARDLSRPDTLANTLLESAVLFFFLLMLVQIIAAVIEMVTGVDVMVFAMWFALLAAFWPLARGVAWSDLRPALGWHTGRGVFIEIACGVAGYLAGLPLVALGIGLVVVLSQLTSSQPSHPVQDQVAIRSAWDAVKLYMLAAVWAPVVEETIFRGAMYFHTRRITGILGSAVLTAFLFAIIHPQGYAGVPVLMALAITFAVMREWRGSLIAPIVAHALNNAFIITLLVLVVS